MEVMDAANIITKTMAAAGRPLTEYQQILLAASVAVCIDALVVSEREACAKTCDNMPKHVDRNNAVIEASASECARAIRNRKCNISSAP